MTLESDFDEWDMRQSLDSVCDDYDLDLREVLHALREACVDDEHEDDDIIHYDFSLDDDRNEDEDEDDYDDVHSLRKHYSDRRQARC